MRRAARAFLACVQLALLATGSSAADDAGALIRQADARQLAAHPYWLALLQYPRRTSVVIGLPASEVLSPDFFLAPTGRTDPAAELAATLAALFAAPGVRPDEHAQCRFVARFNWLRRALDWEGRQPPAVDCARYRAYTMNQQVESLSLVFASGYFSNPGSSFGHLLLKFNFRRSVVASDLLDHSVSFGAAIPRNDNPAAYVLKGLFGGYDGVFSHQQFYSFNHAYAELDLRDMWEYALRLSADEVDQVVAHSWELLGRRYAYFFLKENCALRMAQLLELVVDQPLLPDLPYALPASLFERIAVLEHHGAPLVDSVHRIPSRLNRFREGYLDMPDEERAVVQALAGGAPDLEIEPYRRLPEAAKVAVVDTLLDYYGYRIVLDRADAGLQRARQQLLIARTELPAGPAQGETQPTPAPGAAPPHQGPLPLLVGMGAIHNSQLGDGAQLRVRPANHDQVTQDAGRVPYSSLAMFDLRAVYLDGRVRLRSLDLVNVESLNVAQTPLAGDGGAAWGLSAGLTSQDLACNGCTVLQLGGGLGKAWPVGRQAAVFGMLDLSAQSRHAGAGLLAATPRLGLTGSPAPGWKSYLSVGWRSYLEDSRANRRVTRWENRLGGSRRWDIRLTYEENVAREYGAALSLNW